MIYVTKFRLNDLNPSMGKQVEFYKKTVDEFFHFTEDECDAEIECQSLSDNLFKQKIKAHFKKSPARGDYKIYQNVDGSPSLKDVFLSSLSLTDANNIDDYFAIWEVGPRKYVLLYIPKEALFTKFFATIRDNHILVADNLGNATSATAAMSASYQIIYYGAPGTGKSWTIDQIATKDNSIRTTFHPDTDYAAFVGAYKPTMEEQERYALDATGKTHKIDAKEKTIVYSFVPQAFLKAYVEAWRRYTNADLQGEEKTYYLVIEEINRGNCAQIFGDLFQLLDRNDDGISSYAISPDNDLARFLAEDANGFRDVTGLDDSIEFKKANGEVIVTGADIKSGTLMALPPNLHILATMNTSDQSLFPMDSAFKRRWDWEYVPITDAQEGYVIKTATKSYDWYAFLEAMNEKILSATESEDKQMGYFFAKPRNGKEISADVFVNKVFFYLWNTIFKDCYTEQDFLKLKDEGGQETGQYLTFTTFFKDKDGCIDLLMQNLGVLAEEGR